MNKKPYTLIIMDGFGIAPEGEGNAIARANTPVLDNIFASCPGCQLQASGLDVGLPEGQMGNSEVGHTNIGAGRVVFQVLPRISLAIKDGSFFENEAYLKAVANCKAHNSALHIFGLLSNGGVHSHIDHIFAMLDLAKREGLTKVYLHAFLDGRDVPPSSGKDFVTAAAAKCAETGARIATVAGRFYAMDRDKRWDRLEKAYRAIVCGEAPFEPDPVAAVQKSYDNELTDEFMLPVVCVKDAELKANDSVIFANFRPDRAREITRSIVDEDFDGFERPHGFFPTCYICTAEYDATMPNVSVAFPPASLDCIFGDYISRKGLTQLRIAETEKYAHVTFFFNGGEERVFPGEDRVLVDSPKVATYDLQPEMSAIEVTDKCVERIESGKYDVIILNLANCDMVGHTGNIPAAIQAVETVDTCVGRIVEATTKLGGVAIVTADHGNADRMLAEDGVSPFTAHSTNPVPFRVVGADVKLKCGKLSDITPTMLDLMGLEKPEQMTGESLIIHE